MKYLISIILLTLGFTIYTETLKSTAQTVGIYNTSLGVIFDVPTKRDTVKHWGKDWHMLVWADSIVPTQKTVATAMDTMNNRMFRAMADTAHSIRDAVILVDAASGLKEVRIGNQEWLYVNMDSVASKQHEDSVNNSLFGLVNNRVKYVDTPAMLAPYALKTSLGSNAFTSTAYYPNSNPDGYISSVPAQSWSSITGKPTTLSGYGITDAYPLSGNPSGFITSSALSPYLTTSTAASTYQPVGSYLTGINNGMVIAALGMTPVSQSGARSAITLTTTGSSGAATYNSTSGVLNIPTPSASGTVTSIGLSSSDLNISGSPITTSGTMTASLTTTGVSAGIYGSSTAVPIITVDAKGRITGVTTAVPTVSPITISSTATGDVTWTTSGTSSISPTTTLSNTGVTAGSYGAVTVDAKGRVSSGKRLNLYSGTTNSSGAYTVTFSPSYSSAPNIQASITNQSATNQFIRVSSVSTTGCTVNVFQRSSVTLLGIEVLLAAITDVNGANVDILVTEK